MSRRTRPRDERGSALVIVIGAMTVLSLVVGVALTHAVRGLEHSTHARDWKQALAAAEAGVDDYLARLNRNDQYWQNADCSNVAMKGARTTGGSACGWTTGTAPGWLTVPGSTGAEFHYDVTTTSTYVDGTVDLTSTGRAGGVTRSIQVALRRGGFGEFLYYTVYETTDPADERTYGVNNATALDKCAHYYWEPTSATSKPRDTSYCSDIQFASADVINGPMHSNDAILIGGSAKFLGTTTTSWPACQPVGGVPRPATSCYRRTTTSVTPTFSKGIAYRSEIELPTTLGDLRTYVDGSQPNPGCLYTGPTRIVFNPTSGTATPTMKVWSPYSKDLNAGCGTTTALRSTAGATVTVPQNKLVMVQNLPSGWSPAPSSSGACADGAIGGYPQSEDYAQTLAEASCRYGTVYLEGQLKGRLTISADNNIVVTDNITYAGGTTGTDALGLIASNNVKIYHPVARTCTTYDKYGRCTKYSDYENIADPDGATLTNVEVDASILTLQHSFTVTSYQYGDPLGKLKVFGSIAQRYRGPVGTGSATTRSSGYAKDYNYDTRLRYAPPPYFLDPVKASWGQKTFGEVTPAY